MIFAASAVTLPRQMVYVLRCLFTPCAADSPPAPLHTLAVIVDAMLLTMLF